MKEYLLRSCLALALMLTAQTLQAQSVFSPKVNGVRSSFQTRRAASPDAGKELGTFMVTCSPTASAAAIANEMIDMGAEINSLMGNMLIATLPMSALEDVAAIEGVLLIDLPGTSTQKTDQVRKASHVDEAHQGKAEGQKELPQAYTGKGVIIGLIDGGYDFTHPIFKDKDGKLRIKGYYTADPTLREEGESLTNISVTDNKGVTTKVTLPGAFVTNADVLLDTLKVKDAGGTHGGHCAAIAAGSIMNDTKGLSGGALGGMAPEAELILTSPFPTDAQVKESSLSRTDLKRQYENQALWLMKKYAEDQGKPLVVSWSANSQDGFHDGTSSQSRYVAEYCKAGNVMALCASNEGSDSMFIERKINKKDTVFINTFPEISSAYIYGFIKTTKNIKISMNVLDADRRVVYNCELPLQSEGTDDYEKSFAYMVEEKGGTKKWFYYNDYYGMHGPMGNLTNYIKDGYLKLSINKGSLVDANGQNTPYVRFEWCVFDFYLEKDPNSKDGLNYTVELEVTSPDEDVTMYAWGEYYSMQATTMEDKSRYFPGDSYHSIGDMNTSGEPVSIGAYAANITRYNDKGELVDNSKFEQVGRYASFSSYGYDMSSQHRTYPDVSAPGYAVLSANNSFAPDKYVWGEKTYEGQFKGQDSPRKYSYIFASGTSMATPAAAGIIALWMQAAKDKGKTLTNKDVKDIIAHSSETDEFTKANPLRYGAGKINAYKGLLYVLDTQTSIPELPTKHISATLNGRTLHVSGNPDVQVTVYNLSGVKVLDTQAQSGIVELPNLPAGVYAVKIGNQGSTLVRL